MALSTYKALMIFFASAFAISLYGMAFTATAGFLSGFEFFFDNTARISFVMLFSTIISLLFKNYTKTYIS